MTNGLYMNGCKYVPVTLLLFLLWIQDTSGHDELTCFTLAPLTHVSIGCPSGSRILITSAIYGASPFGLCYGTGKDCTQQVPLPMRCCGRQACTFDVRNRYLTKCMQPATYYQVYYMCVKGEVECQDTDVTEDLPLKEVDESLRPDKKSLNDDEVGGPSTKIFILNERGRNGTERTTGPTPRDYVNNVERTTFPRINLLVTTKNEKDSKYKTNTESPLGNRTTQKRSGTLNFLHGQDGNERQNLRARGIGLSRFFRRRGNIRRTQNGYANGNIETSSALTPTGAVTRGNENRFKPFPGRNSGFNQRKSDKQPDSSFYENKIRLTKSRGRSKEEINKDKNTNFKPPQQNYANNRIVRNFLARKIKDTVQSTTPLDQLKVMRMMANVIYKPKYTQRTPEPNSNNLDMITRQSSVETPAVSYSKADEFSQIIEEKSRVGSENKLDEEDTDLMAILQKMQETNDQDKRYGTKRESNDMKHENSKEYEVRGVDSMDFNQHYQHEKDNESEDLNSLKMEAMEKSSTEHITPPTLFVSEDEQEQGMRGINRDESNDESVNEMLERELHRKPETTTARSKTEASTTTTTRTTTTTTPKRTTEKKTTPTTSRTTTTTEATTTTRITPKKLITEQRTSATPSSTRARSTPSNFRNLYNRPKYGNKYYNRNNEIDLSHINSLNAEVTTPNIVTPPMTTDKQIRKSHFGNERISDTPQNYLNERRYHETSPKPRYTGRRRQIPRRHLSKPNTEANSRDRTRVNTHTMGTHHTSMPANTRDRVPMWNGRKNTVVSWLRTMRPTYPPSIKSLPSMAVTKDHISTMLDHEQSHNIDFTPRIIVPDRSRNNEAYRNGDEFQEKTTQPIAINNIKNNIPDNIKNNHTIVTPYDILMEEEKIATHFTDISISLGTLLTIAGGEALIFLVLLIVLGLYLKRFDVEKLGSVHSNSMSISTSLKRLRKHYKRKSQKAAGYRFGSTSTAPGPHLTLARQPAPAWRKVQSNERTSSKRPNYKYPHRQGAVNTVCNVVEAEINVNTNPGTKPCNVTVPYAYEEACTAFNVPSVDGRKSACPSVGRRYAGVIGELSETISKVQAHDHKDDEESMYALSAEDNYTDDSSYDSSPITYENLDAHIAQQRNEERPHNHMNEKLKAFAENELEKIDEQIHILLHGLHGNGDGLESNV